MGDRKPSALLLENVPSLATSKDGRDLRLALLELNRLGYWCDLLVLDARLFVAQSRQRLFIIASQKPLGITTGWGPSPLRPPWLRRFVLRNPDLKLNALPLKPPPALHSELPDVIERLAEGDSRWWGTERAAAFFDSLAPLHRRRLEVLRTSPRTRWATAYRRTRNGRAIWEIRNDAISGCLRTSRGGSSKQAVVEGGQGTTRVRWMTSTEYARLQGVWDFKIPPTITESQALFGFGDAVCVPAVEWIAGNYLRPLLEGGLSPDLLTLEARELALPLSYNAI
jgi:DNA (cytosine-5)-methyltransferase 1